MYLHRNFRQPLILEEVQMRAIPGDLEMTVLIEVIIEGRGKRDARAAAENDLVLWPLLYFKSIFVLR